MMMSICYCAVLSSARYRILKEFDDLECVKLLVLVYKEHRYTKEHMLVARRLFLTAALRKHAFFRNPSPARDTMEKALENEKLREDWDQPVPWLEQQPLVGQSVGRFCSEGSSLVFVGVCNDEITTKDIVINGKSLTKRTMIYTRSESQQE